MPIISQACSCGIICNQGTFSSMPSGDSFSHSKFELKTYPIFGMTFFWTFLSNVVCMTTIGLTTNLIWLKFPTAFKGATKLNDFLISLKVEIGKNFWQHLNGYLTQQEMNFYSLQNQFFRRWLAVSNYII